MTAPSPFEDPFESDAELVAFRDAQIAEYTKWMADPDGPGIVLGNALAHPPGDPVPTSNVERWGHAAAGRVVLQHDFVDRNPEDRDVKAFRKFVDKNPDHPASRGYRRYAEERDARDKASGKVVTLPWQQVEPAQVPADATQDAATPGRSGRGASSGSKAADSGNEG